MAPNETTQDEGGEPAPPGAADADSNDVPEVQIDPSIGPAPVKPHHSVPKVNSIREGPMFIPATAIRTALKS